MKYLSVCSGIEAASVAWHPLGFEPVGFSEIEKFPAAVLRARFPHVQNFGDMNGFESWDLEAIDILVGGTPCQSFSVAGLRKGMADSRGNLALVYCRILDRFRPKWFVWENVPGVLSSGRGRDFGSFLGAVAKLGYGFAYRVLDAQWFGVPQRRRRVFVVGCLGDWRSAAAVLFERESLSGNIAKGKGKKQKTAKSPGGGIECDLAKTLVSGGHSNNPIDENLIACTLPASDGGVSSGMHPVIPCGVTIHGTDKTAKVMSYTDIAGSLRTKPPGSQENSSTTAVLAFNARQDPDSWENRTGPIDTDGCTQAVAFQCHGSNVGEMGTLRAGNGNESGGVPFLPVAFAENSRSEIRLEGGDGNRTGALSTGGGKPGQGSPVIQQAMQVRRLTPRECERLQGFPDDWTAIEYRGKPACDGPRYKAIGNSMAVPVMRWIGERLSAAI